MICRSSSVVLYAINAAQWNLQLRRDRRATSVRRVVVARRSHRIRNRVALVTTSLMISTAFLEACHIRIYIDKCIKFSFGK